MSDVAVHHLQGTLVYVNYGRIDDFIHLTEVVGIDPTGHICIARYGKIFRGDKVTYICICIS